MGSWSSMINEWLAAIRTKQTLRNIEFNNELRRNIKQYDDSDIEGFVERDKMMVCNTIITGINSSNQLERGASSVAACALNQGLPVVIIHEGNHVLESKIESYTNFSNMRAILSSNCQFYDPFYNRSLTEVVEMVGSCGALSTKVGMKGQQFLSGVLEYFESKGGQFFVNSLIQCPFNDIVDVIDSAYQSGKITEGVKNSCLSDISNGQEEAYNVKQFFKQLNTQGNGLIATSSILGQQVNIKAAIRMGGLISIDIGSRSNKTIFNIIMNDLVDAISTVGASTKVVVIVDRIDITSNKMLEQLVSSPTNNMVLALISDDVYSMLGANNNLFTSVSTRADRIIMMTAANNLSSEKLANIIGVYDKDEVTKVMGGSKSYYTGSYSDTTSISVAQKKEFIVKPQELLDLPENEAYIRDTINKELAHVKFKV